MPAEPRPQPLGRLARAGFHELGTAGQMLAALVRLTDRGEPELLDAFAHAADPDAALARVHALVDAHPALSQDLGRAELGRLIVLLGASPAFGDVFMRSPHRLPDILRCGGRLPNAEQAREELLVAVDADPEAVQPTAGRGGMAGWVSLRIRYRELLAEVMLHDLRRAGEGGAAAAFDAVAAALSDLATAALDAALAVARATLVAGDGQRAVAAETLAGVRLAVLALGKCGARELNVVSDVDVVFIAEPSDPGTGGPSHPLDADRVIRIATRLAAETMRAIHDPAPEPPLWQVDANLRPEGRHGPLVRSLGSMLGYYERWAKTWEFQALIKARPVAGDLALGAEFVRRTRPLVWGSSGREDFVGSVQRMRERVTEHIAPAELEIELKLGPGGLRDIEFSVQLLQLVHGQYDERIHLRGTLPALAALVEGGYVARSDGERLAADYRRLRVLEHRLQLRELRRTALMPRDEDALRVLARSSGLARTGPQLRALWEEIKRDVRELHLKIFYAPLLAAVAALPEEELVLGSERAGARLTSIGFRDPDGAMRHLSALTRGTSRRARIQRNLMPVLLRWLAEGTDPDAGLLAFRRVSEANRDTPWYLRLLRDGSDAAERLTRVLSSSRFAAELLESIPEAVAWLEQDERLRPRPLTVLLEEMRSLASRRESPDAAAVALRAVHRREMLRLALGRLVGVLDDGAVSEGLDAAHTALLDGLLLALRRDRPAAGVELALIGMGRYGGREMGFASDIDLLAVFRAPAGSPDAGRTAERLVTELRRLVSDPRFPVDLDFELRPEGKTGVLVRSLDSYRAYYERWSLTWEAQALLRARAVAGDPSLGADFIALADRVRYPEHFGEDEVREVRRMKARVEAERLPRGADPRRHLKLGPGGLSDVEWLVQLVQLRFAASRASLRTVRTRDALDAATECGLLDEPSRALLMDAWSLASALRSAARLWSGRVLDSLPSERGELDGIAGILGFPPGHTGELEERWYAAARRARAVVEREFFDW